MATDDISELIFELPSDVRYFRPIRLAIAGVAAVVGFDVDAIDDLRIGVDELCGVLDEIGDGSAMALRVEASVGGSIRIDGTCAADGGPSDPDRLEFSKRILSVVADEHGIEEEGGAIRCWLRRELEGQESGPSAAP